MQCNTSSTALELFSDCKKTKRELLSLLVQENLELANFKANCVVVYSTACYDELNGIEVQKTIEYFSKVIPGGKYKSFSFCTELYMLLFRPKLMNAEDFDLIREAVTYFDDSTTDIYVGYVDGVTENGPQGFNLP